MSHTINVESSSSLAKLPLAPVTQADDTNITQQSKIMIVDDEPLNIKVVRKYLQGAGYSNFISTSDATDAMEIMRGEQPDVVLLDIMMPQVSGLDILDAMRLDDKLRHIPTIILTASADPYTKTRALELGANDFLAKPVDPNDLAPRVRNALVVKAHQDHLANYAEKLKKEVRDRTAELEVSRQEIIHCLARAGEYRDHETGHHVIRVGMYVSIIARNMGFPDDMVELMEQASLLHDVGKIGISDLILLKPGKLTIEEFEVMKKHCEFGRNIIDSRPDHRWDAFGRDRDFGTKIPGSPIIQMAARIAMTHHEHWDGSGYPRGLTRQEIPVEGRITAVADVFDALSSMRPYKQPYPVERCLEMVKEKSGSHFDPEVVAAFFAGLPEVERVRTKYADETPEEFVEQLS